MTSPARSSRLTCLGGELPEYAAGRLTPQRRAGWDLHLVACAVCRAAVQEERRLQAALVDGPMLSGALRGALLALAVAPDVEPSLVPVPATRLVTLAPTAPACHRSVLRSALLAAAAAGASAAAAWSLSVTGGAGPLGVRSATFLPAPASSPGAPAGSGVGSLSASIVRFYAPAVESGTTRRAESTP